MIAPLLVGGAAIGGLLLFALHDDNADGRTVMLVQGKRYAIAHRITGPGWDVSMYPGFCNFSDPVITAEGNGWGEVQFEADWCATNRSWDVPAELAIAEV